MKKRIFLLICAVMCLFFVLCSCGCNDTGATQNSQNNQNDASQNQQGGTGGNQGDTSGSQIITPPANKNEGSTDIVVPETKCSLSERGHYWSEVSFNKNTASSGTISVMGKCHLCKESLSQLYTTIVDYNQWKAALSEESLSSFTAIMGDKYVDYDEKGSLEWSETNYTYTADYFINFSEKSSKEYAKNFQGFSLKYNDFKYDSISKTYVCWISEESYVELGFAEGNLIYHAVGTKNGEGESKTQTIYLNHKRVSVSAPDFIIEKYESAVTLENLLKSNLSESNATLIYNELKSFSFEWKFEASLLENDRISVYFYLDSPREEEIYGGTYSTASIQIDNNIITSVSFGSTAFELSYN